MHKAAQAFGKADKCAVRHQALHRPLEDSPGRQHGNLMVDFGFCFFLFNGFGGKNQLILFLIYGDDSDFKLFSKPWLQILHIG